MKFLKILGWLFVPYIMLGFQWKNIGTVGKVMGSIWSVICLIGIITPSNSENQQQATAQTVSTTTTSGPSVDDKAKQEENAKAKAEDEAKAKAEAEVKAKVNSEEEEEKTRKKALEEALASANAIAKENAEKVKQTDETTKPSTQEQTPTNMTPEEETKKLRPHYDNLKKIFADIKNEYAAQQQSFDPMSWGDFARATRAKIDQERDALDKTFVFGLMSDRQNAENLLLMNEVAVNMYVDVITQMWKELDGSGGDPSSAISQIEKDLKQIKFE